MLSYDLGTPWRDMSLIAVDVEATGLDIDEARIIEVGMVRFERGQVAERWGTLVDPGVPIPADATRVTGITDEMVAGKPSFRDIKWDLWGRLRDRIFVAYNAPYDLGVITNELRRVGLTPPEVAVLDPLVWARQFMPIEKRHRLGAVCAKLGIPLDQAHRAEADAEAAGKVLFRLADKVPLELGTLLTEQGGWAKLQTEQAEMRRAERIARNETLGKTPRAPTAEPDEETNQSGLFG